MILTFMFILPQLSQVDVRAMTTWSVKILAFVLLGMFSTLWLRRETINIIQMNNKEVKTKTRGLKGM